MDFTIILGYMILILIQYFSIQAIPVSLIGGIINKITNSILFSMLVGGLITWFFINLIWLKVNNHNIPLLLFAICWFIKIYKSLGDNNTDIKTNNLLLKSEASTIVVIALYVLIFKEFNWY